MLKETESLISYDFSTEFDFLWDPKLQTRAIYLAKIYGYEQVHLFLRYVIQGGANDMFEFAKKYQGRYNFCRLRGWKTEDKDVFYENVKRKMQKISNSTKFNFLYCPFMKKRSMELVNIGLNENQLNEILCYTLWGEELSNHQIDERAKSRYLKKMGIFP